MIASLGMYDRTETAPALDRFWAAIRDGLRARGGHAPEALTRGDAACWPAWQSPDLFFSQTCGLPFRSGLLQHVSIVGTPDSGVEGCGPGYYRSDFIARADDQRQTPGDFTGAAFAFNEGLSQSGWAAAVAWFVARGLDLRPCVESGSHRQSALSVLNGLADFAAIDAVTWSLLCKHEDWTQRLRVVGHTDPTPSLPYITARGDPDALFDAVTAAIKRIGPQDRATLRLKGLVRIPASTYLEQTIPAPPVLMDHPKQACPRQS